MLRTSRGTLQLEKHTRRLAPMSMKLLAYCPTLDVLPWSQELEKNGVAAMSPAAVPVLHARTRPAWRTCSRKSGVPRSILTVRHISYRRDLILSPMRFHNASSVRTEVFPLGDLISFASMSSK